MSAILLNLHFAGTPVIRKLIVFNNYEIEFKIKASGLK